MGLTKIETHFQSRQHLTRDPLTLEPVAAVLNELGIPQKLKNKKKILVAGTNGKGTFCYAIEHLLLHHKQKISTFLSPHVLRLEERFRYQGRLISQEQLDKLTHKIFPLITKYQLSYFESLWLIYCLWNVQIDSEIMMIEVGLGGRLDATNSLDPDMSVLTSVGLDHQEYLGSTLEKIANEKLGILRAEKPLFVPFQDNHSIRDTIVAATTKIKSPLKFVASLQSHIAQKNSALVLQYQNQLITLNHTQPAMLPSLSLAIEVCQELLCHSPELKVLETLKVPFRFEKLGVSQHIYFSNAHNEEAILSTLSHYYSLHPKGHVFSCFPNNRDLRAAEALIRENSSFFHFFEGVTPRKSLGDLQVSHFLSMIQSHYQANSPCLFIGSHLFLGVVHRAQQSLFLLEATDSSCPPQ